MVAHTSNKRLYLSSSLELPIHSSRPGSMQWNSSGTISDPAPKAWRTVEDCIMPIIVYNEVFPVVRKTSEMPSSPKEDRRSGRFTRRLKAVAVSRLPFTAGQIQVFGRVIK